jgi:hypothetical protein
MMTVLAARPGEQLRRRPPVVEERPEGVEDVRLRMSVSDCREKCLPHVLSDNAAGLRSGAWAERSQPGIH